MRSNQEMEASNKYKNAQSREVTQGRKPTGWDWVKLSQRLEKRTNNRLNRIEESGKIMEKGAQGEIKARRAMQGHHQRI